MDEDDEDVICRAGQLQRDTLVSILTLAADTLNPTETPSQNDSKYGCKQTSLGRDSCLFKEW